MSHKDHNPFSIQPSSPAATTEKFSGKNIATQENVHVEETPEAFHFSFTATDRTEWLRLVYAYHLFLDVISDLFEGDVDRYIDRREGAFEAPPYTESFTLDKEHIYPKFRKITGKEFLARINALIADKEVDACMQDREERSEDKIAELKEDRRRMVEYPKHVREFIQAIVEKRDPTHVFPIEMRVEGRGVSVYLPKEDVYGGPRNKDGFYLTNGSLLMDLNIETTREAQEDYFGKVRNGDCRDLRMAPLYVECDSEKEAEEWMQTAKRTLIEYVQAKEKRSRKDRRELLRMAGMLEQKT